MKFLSFIVFVLFNQPGAFSAEDCKKNCILENKPQTAPRVQQKNLLGGKLDQCSLNPLTGYDRSGYCRFFPNDRGKHLVCAQVSKEFLEFTKKQGNDLSTPNMRYGFPGLKPGDRWCLCSSRVIEANRSGLILRVIKESTNEFAWK